VANPNAIAGKNGSVYIPGTPNAPIGEITQWQIQADRENYDQTALGDDWKRFVIGLAGWSGSLTGFYAIPSDSAGQLVVYNALINGIEFACQFVTAVGGGFFEGIIHVTQFTVGNPNNNLVSIAFTFTGNGTLQHLP
jgi:hypothetical protein